MRVERRVLMKRSIFKLCLFLLLGAIINVAVAWGQHTVRTRVVAQKLRTRVSPSPSQWLIVCRRDTNGFASEVPADLQLSWIDFASPIQCGWPTHSLERSILDPPSGRPVVGRPAAERREVMLAHQEGGSGPHLRHG